MQLYLHIVRNLNLRYICFSKKAIKTVLGFKQLLLPILNWVFCAFYTSSLILIFSDIFMLEAVNPTNIQVSLDSLNVNMNLFPGGHALVTQAPSAPASFDFCFMKNSMSKLSPGSATGSSRQKIIF